MSKVQRALRISERQNVWLGERSQFLGISVSEMVRRVLDEVMEEEFKINSKTDFDSIMDYKADG